MKNKSEQLFDDIKGAYNYCPSPVMTSDNELYIFYCANTLSKLVIDDIYMRQGELVNEKWSFSDRKVVLKPSRNGWDCIHVCDPEVIRGEFTYDGEIYNYLMLYLGCDMHFCIRNQLGVAVAKNIDGPYIKIEANPVVGYDEIYHWGVGQASAVSLDKKGKVRLVYTKTVYDYCRKSNKATAFWQDVDFSDLNYPILGEEVMLCPLGIVNSDGTTADNMVNVTFAYDEEEKKYYFTREGTPFERDDVPDFIAPYTQVMSISREDFEKNVGGWEVVKNITVDDTGYRRTHNGGIFKDCFGLTKKSRPLSVGVTVSELNVADFLYTYRIHEILV